MLIAEALVSVRVESRLDKEERFDLTQTYPLICGEEFVRKEIEAFDKKHKKSAMLHPRIRLAKVLVIETT